MSREQAQQEMSRLPGEWFLLPSAFRRKDQTPYFEMPMRREDLSDLGAASLYMRESRLGGFEFPTRLFLMEHLAPGDLFLDAGAHWGLYSLTALTVHPGQIKALAVEPHPDNVARLRLWLSHNGVEDQALVASAALSDAPGQGQLFLNTTMGHRLAQDQETAIPPGYRAPMAVPVETLDRLLAADSAAGLLAQASRVILKMDVEGNEPRVFLGALNLLRSGKVAAIIWERGREHNKPENHRMFVEGLSVLHDMAFDSYRFPHEDGGGPLIPYVPSTESCNILSLARDFPRRAVYPKPWSPLLVQGRDMRPPMSAPQLLDYVERLIRAKATDAGRWTAWERLLDPASHLRAGLAAQHLPRGGSVLDLGCGLMFLRDHLGPNSTYIPLDLMARGPRCLVADLNQGHYPKGRVDAVAMLHLLEYIHDPKALLSWARTVTGRLVLSYVPVERLGGNERRAAGFFNDLTVHALAGLLAECGWTQVTRDAVAGEVFFVCQAPPPEPAEAPESSAPEETA
jgi:FkbM family methyltransferase